MVLEGARAELRAALRELVAGRLDCSDYEEFYDTKCVGSADAGVSEIGAFGEGLCENSPPLLKGRHAVTPEVEAVVERCDLFLRSGLEYRWPPPPNVDLTGTGWALVLFSMIGVTTLNVLATVSACASGAHAAASCLALLVPPGIVAIRLAWKRLDGCQECGLDKYWSHGEREVWPFLDRAQMQRIVGESGRGANP